MNSKLTLDLGLRYDFFPTVTEVHDAESYFSPSLANPITGVNGALQFTGHGAGTCNCATPVSNYFKNFGPRVGVAFQLDPDTVVRAELWSHVHARRRRRRPCIKHRNVGLLRAPSFSANGQLLSTMPLTGTNGVFPLTRARLVWLQDHNSAPASPLPPALPARLLRSVMSTPTTEAGRRST